MQKITGWREVRDNKRKNSVSFGATEQAVGFRHHTVAYNEITGTDFGNRHVGLRKDEFADVRVQSESVHAVSFHRQNKLTARAVPEHAGATRGN